MYECEIIWCKEPIPEKLYKEIIKALIKELERANHL